MNSIRQSNLTLCGRVRARSTTQLHYIQLLENVHILYITNKIHNEYYPPNTQMLYQRKLDNKQETVTPLIFTNKSPPTSRQIVNPHLALKGTLQHGRNHMIKFLIELPDICFFFSHEPKTEGWSRTSICMHWWNIMPISLAMHGVYLSMNSTNFLSNHP